MAKTIAFNEPLDQPHLVKQGVTCVEGDFPGNAKYLALPPESPIRRAKGDLGNSHIPGFEPRFSFEGGVGAKLPFRVKKG